MTQPQTLYVAEISSGHPLLTDPATDFTSARLTDVAAQPTLDGGDPAPHSAFISIGGQEFHAKAYPAHDVTGVNQGSYETLVAMLPHDSELPSAAITRKNEPLLMRYEWDELPGYEYIHCGAYRLSRILNLTRHAEYGWQMVFSQASESRPRDRYKSDCAEP